MFRGPGSLFVVGFCCRCSAFRSDLVILAGHLYGAKEKEERLPAQAQNYQEAGAQEKKAAKWTKEQNVP